MLSGVTVMCFLLSYLVVLVIEASRFVVQVPGRTILVISMMGAGLFAHSIFLANQLTVVSEIDGQPQLLANWFQWMVLAAWGLAVACMFLTVKDPNRSMGLFMIPVILGIIGIGTLFQESAPFSPQTTIGIWKTIHGVSLLVGSMFICFGFAFGIMYLLQSHRLKKLSARISSFKLPSLEFAHSMNRLSLFVSSASLAVGVLSGVVLNVSRDGPINWMSGSILFPLALFVWTLTATCFELMSSSSLGGRRSAFLVIANFVFLSLVMTVVWWSSHGQPTEQASASQNRIVICKRSLSPEGAGNQARSGRL